MKEQKFLTREQLSLRWGVSTRTIDRRRTSGVLPWRDFTIGMGTRPQVRFSIDDVAEFERRTRMSPGCFSSSKDEVDDHNSSEYSS